MRNNLLHLNKTFIPAARERSPFAISFYKSLPVTLNHLNSLLQSLKATKIYWDRQNLLNNKCLISAYCFGIIAKTNRISELFKSPHKQVNDMIVGARFGGEGNQHYHIFTYCMTKNNLTFAIFKLENLIKVFNELFQDEVSKDGLTIYRDNKTLVLSNEYFSKNQFIALIEELSYISRFDIYVCEEVIEDNAIVTLFNTDSDIIQLFKEININLTNERINSNNILLFPDEFARLKAVAPYLIAMAVSDFSLIGLPDSLNENELSVKKIEEPSNEPIIGVIDTLFKKDVYFSKWVEYVEELDTSIITPASEDYAHGTAVSSLIVDLPNINPELDDGCGHFRVKHFGVALRQGGMTTFKLMKKIESIVDVNPNIHVWNLSLGSTRAINNNFISPEASILDDLQVKYPNIIFVIAGTNSEAGKVSGLIGAPADSINSIVVNSVRKSDNGPASYSRSGPALSFFIKPDISYYGGDYDEPLNVCYPYKIVESWGTSFAAPLIARKLAYMIDILKIPRECAKALLIDSAVGWERKFNLNDSNLIGRGIVPIDIHDIVQSQADEIKFYIDGESKKYRSYEYNLPVPLNKDHRFPYVARATLCYFPKCSRNQGVDYTDTELNIKFGRTRDGKKQPIEPIDKDYQDIEGYFVKEKEARGLFRKWDNIKVLTDSNIDKKQAKKVLGRDNWGIEVIYSRRYVNRKDFKDPQGVKWGIVITLKAIDGKNRIDEFIRMCSLNDWRVYPVSVENMSKVYAQSQVDIDFKN